MGFGATLETNNLIPVIGLAPAHLPPIENPAVDIADIQHTSRRDRKLPDRQQPAALRPRTGRHRLARALPGGITSTQLLPLMLGEA